MNLLQKKLVVQKTALMAFVSLVCVVGFGTHIALAEGNFIPLVGIPNLPDNPGDIGLPGYINALYLLVVVLGAMIAVIKIAIAGVQYSMSDVVTTKQGAISDIKGALIGLAILLIPFIVLNLIYPNLTSLKVLDRVPRVNLKETSSNASTPSPQTTPPVVYSKQMFMEECKYLSPSPTCTVEPSCDTAEQYDYSAGKATCVEKCTTPPKSGTFSDKSFDRGVCVYDRLVAGEISNTNNLLECPPGWIHVSEWNCDPAPK